MKNRLIDIKLHLILFSLLLLSACGKKLSAQNIVQELSNEMCQCIELACYKNASEIEPCYDKLFSEQLSLIKNGKSIQ